MSSLEGKSSQEITNTATNFCVLPWAIPPEIHTHTRAMTPASATTTWKKQGCAGPQVLDMAAFWQSGTNFRRSHHCDGFLSHFSMACNHALDICVLHLQGALIYQNYLMYFTKSTPFSCTNPNFSLRRRFHLETAGAHCSVK